jgi:hypothetical protein
MYCYPKLSRLAQVFQRLFGLYRSKRELTADPPKDGSATVFKAEARRAQSKEFLINKYSELYASLVK